MTRRRNIHPIAGPIVMGILALVFAVVMLGMAVLMLKGLMVG